MDDGDPYLIEAVDSILGVLADYAYGLGLLFCAGVAGALLVTLASW